MSNIVPPCDCIELVDGQYTYRCECSNRDDGERVSAWCVEANYKASADYDRATIEFLRKEATEAADEITALRADNERLREWNREIALNARELVAENERLRAALKPFVCDCEGEAICIGECMHRNARAAQHTGDKHE